MGMTLDINAALYFYDEDRAARRHANAVKTLAGEELGLALFKHYLDAHGRTAEILEDACTCEGARLDGWIEVTSSPALLYQVEVKSWSVHGYGSGRFLLPVNADSSFLRQYKIDAWSHYWDEATGDFGPDGLRKVLRRMRTPQGRDKLSVEPVACLWAAVHPDGANEAFFSWPLGEHHSFKQMHVFSMSSYLRNLLAAGTWKIELSLPNVQRRLEIINGLLR